MQLLFGFTAPVDMLPTTCYWRGYVVVGLVPGTSTAIRADTGDLPFLDTSEGTYLDQDNQRCKGWAACYINDLIVEL